MNIRQIRVAGVLVVVLGAMIFTTPRQAVQAGEKKDYFRSPDFTKPMRSVELQYFRMPAGMA